MPLQVDYEQMSAFEGQLRTKTDEFRGQAQKMRQELDTLRETWSGSEGANAFSGVIDEVQRQIDQLNTNVDNVQGGLRKANTSYGEHDTQVSSAFSSMIAT